MATVTARQKFDDGATFAMPPYPQHDAFVSPLHGRNLTGFRAETQLSVEPTLGVAGKGKIQPGRGKGARDGFDGRAQLQASLADNLHQRNHREQQSGHEHPTRPVLPLPRRQPDQKHQKQDQATSHHCREHNRSIGDLPAWGPILERDRQRIERQRQIQQHLKPDHIPGYVHRSSGHSLGNSSPISRYRSGSSPQFSRTLTNRNRCTGWPTISVSSLRDAAPIALMVAPALPSTILRWLSRSTKIVCSMRIDLSLRSVQLSVSTVD